MKILSLISLVFITFGSTIVFAKDNTVNDPKLLILNIAKTAQLQVEIENQSTTEELRIWREYNSWGAAHWRIFILREEKLITLSQQICRGFTRNVPAYDVIAPGKTITRNLDVNDGSWHGLEGEKMVFTPGDIVVVSYDVPKVDVYPSSELSVIASKSRVWHGVIAAKEIVQE